MFGKKQKQAAQDQVDAANAAAQAAMSDQVPPVSEAGWAAAADATALQRSVGVDPAAFGGPSNAAVADDDPIWEPIGGITIEHYAWISKLASQQGVTDEAGTKAIAVANGIDGDQYWAGAIGWGERMGQNQAVGQRWRKLYDQY